MSKRDLLPRAKLRDVLRGEAKLVGARCDPDAPRGLVSPIEARMHMGIAYGDLEDEERRWLEGRHGPIDEVGVVARALVAGVLAPGEGADVDRAHIVSADVHNVTIEEALERIFEEPDTRARFVFFVHAHALNLAAFDRELADLIADADLVLPDGIGLRIAGRLLGIALKDNVNGTDLLPLVCERAAGLDVPLAFVGGAPGVAEEAARRLMEQHPGLRIPYSKHGYLDEEASSEVAREIDALGRVVVLVGMGTPVQERWSLAHLRDCSNATVVTVGGLFDFFSGRQPRAPLVWRELGLEWLHRLVHEPKRLGKRYVLGNPLFLALAVKQKLTGRDE